jgi:hypothetical protein
MVRVQQEEATESMPFSISDVYEGLAEVEGIARCEDDVLILAFQRRCQMRRPGKGEDSMKSLRRARRNVLLSVMLLPHVVLVGIAMAQGAPKVHELRPTPDTVHRGFFDASLKPVLTIDSGDIVRVWTASGNPRYYENLGVPKEKIPAELYRVYEGVEDARRWDHTLSGPISVNNAQPGDTLEIRNRSIDLWLPIAGQGIVPNRGLLPQRSFRMPVIACSGSI